MVDFEGTFAVVSIMLGKVVKTHASDSDSGYTEVEIATLVCFIVGVMLVNITFHYHNKHFC
jgi:hypothetical protein